MGDIHYIHDLPRDRVLVDRTTIVLDRATFERIADYSWSRPTAPKPGRIFRRNEKNHPRHGVNEPDRWVVWIVDVALDRQGRPRPGYVTDYPKRVVLIDEAAA